MPEYTQERRRISIETPLGKDVLLLAGFSGHEGLSEPFHFHVDLLSTDDAIKPADIVGKNVSIRVELIDGSDRWFNGYVSRFSYTGTDDRLSHYDAEIVPWLWFLDRTADCKIFQEKTVVEIIEEVFGDHGIAVFDTGDVIGSHPQREYCVQYRETDFAFVSRLMEEEGIFYRFEHDDSQHKMLLSDHKGSYEKCPEKEVEFRTHITARDFDEMIMSWEHRYEYRSGKMTHTDYNFKTPSAPMEAESPTVLDLESIDSYEVFDYPGEYTEKGDGQDLAKIRMEEEETPHEIVESTSRCRTYFAGGTFTIKQHHSSAEEGKEYVITSINHSASAHHAYETGGEGVLPEYTNEFTCIPASVQFRPARTTPRPMVRGIQTAVVVGPGGEEIYTDEYGRVKVQFHWDRYGKTDENSSCWIRVAQIWAGDQWGGICIPRMGQEVVVDFVEGDPDRPLITGRVYHAELMPPYGLPGNMTQSGIKSRSSKGGSADNFNEIRFEDKMGEEQLYIHAEKNEDIVVENDKTENVGHDETIEIGNDRTETVGHDETITVMNDRVETVNNNETLTVVNNRTRTVQNNETVTVAKQRTHTVGINETITVGAAQEVTVGAARAVTVGANQTVNVGVNQDISVGKDESLDVGKKLTINAGDQILIQTGKASILMKKDGTIQIKGKDITVQGSGQITEKATKNIVMKGKKIIEN